MEEDTELAQRVKMSEADQVSSSTRRGSKCIGVDGKDGFGERMTP